MYSKLLVGKKIWCCSLFWWLISFFWTFIDETMCNVKEFMSRQKKQHQYICGTKIFLICNYFSKRYYYYKQDFYIKICNYFSSCFMHNLCLTNQQIYVGQHHFSNKRRKKKRDLWFSTRKINQSFQQPFANGVDI